MTLPQRTLKRGVDIVLASCGLVALGWLLPFAWLASCCDTRANGFFRQKRVGKNGRAFNVIKIRTMRVCPSNNSTVTTTNDPRITTLGRFWRRTKIDELPQLINVLLGQMSFVGPRPDVPGFADKLQGQERLILAVRPGITGPATLKYRHEEQLLADQEDPERYNLEVIWPDKVRINMDYVRNWSLRRDVEYIWRTISGR